MKKFFLLVMAIISTGMIHGQVMKELPGLRYHAMSENGKWMLSVQQGWIGILNTETDEFQEYDDFGISYDLGLGNMVTNDGFLVGAVNGMPSILDIENKKWTPLGLKEGDCEAGGTQANAISKTRKYIVGSIGINPNSFGRTRLKPVIWTQKEDGTYGEYEELPYPTKDFSGRQPQYILTNGISDDGTIIAAQMVNHDNQCLPMIYRKAKDGTWTYEVYDKEVCEPGLEFPEFPTEQPSVPDLYEYMTQEQIEAYKKDSTAYEDSLWSYNIGESDVLPTYWPDKRYYASEEANELFNEAWKNYETEYNAFMEKLQTFWNFYEENVNLSFYGQNAVRMSPNGKYYATSCEKDRSLGDAALFTINDTLEKHDYEDNLYGFSATNDGDFFVSNTSTAYVYPAGSSERVTLVEWLRMKGEDEAADWLSNITTGTAICSGDGRVISGFTGGGGMYDSWIIKLDAPATGINDINTDANANVKVYDLQGRLVKEGKASEVKNSLRKGIYVINNRKVAVK